MAVFISRVDLSGELSVIIKSVFHQGRGTVLALSHHGVYIATGMIILPRATVRILFLLGDPEEPVEAEAVVKWENQGSKPMGALPPGYGMRLTNVPPETGLAIREIMESAILPPPRSQESIRESSFTIASPSRLLHKTAR